MITRSVDATLNELAARTCSIVHARDLRSAGIGRDAIRRRIEIGTVAPILPRTYAVGPMCRQPSFEMRCMAGALAAGPGGAITGDSAGALLDVWDRSDGHVHVATPHNGPRRPPPGFTFHRSRGLLLPAGTCRCGPIPIVGFEDMCLQMARTHTKWQLAWVIRRGLHEKLVTTARLGRAVEARRHSPFVSVLRSATRLVDAHSTGTRSMSEDLFLASMLDQGAPEPIVNTRGAHGLTRDEPDFLWKHRRLNVEVDGRQHDEPAQAADDALRDAAVEALGWRVVRVRARDVWRRRARVVRAVMALMSGDDAAVDERRYLVLR